MEKLLTSKELAQAIGASESSMRRWTNSGIIRTARTAGGHRRIAVSEAIRFVRESGVTVVRPEMLGLSDLQMVEGGNARAAGTLAEQLYAVLEAGDAKAARGCVTGLYLKGSSVAGICDGAMQGAMERLGELWRENVRGILVEHRATDICLHALGELKQMIGEPLKEAPVALGGAPEGDPYLLPSMMAGAVLAEAGFRDINFGPNTPLELLGSAAEENKARIVWLSVKAAADGAKMRTRIHDVAGRLEKLGAQLVIGGSGLESLGVRSSKNVHLMETMGELAAFARGLVGVVGVTERGKIRKGL